MGACKVRRVGRHQLSSTEAHRRFPSLSLSSGAIKGWDRRNQFYHQMLASLAKHYDFDLEQSFESLPENIQQVILYGSGRTEIPFNYLNERAR